MINNVQKKIVEPSPSHGKQIIEMKHKKGDINHYVYLYEPFHQKNLIFHFDTCITSNSTPLKNEESANSSRRQQKQKQRKVNEGSSPL